MKNIFLLFISLFLFISCNKPKTPEYVIPHEKMVNIIVDMHLLDGMLTVNEIRREIAGKDTSNIYNSVLNYYGYSRHDFDTSLFYYSKNITEYDVIYQEVLNRLGEIESRIKEEQKQKAIKDSLGQ
ncbi:MAG TPA: DUF4296 domain-containing protein [Bacteroidales bacterium]|nr:DUF4296 domain-containing protein [Bacteroidales bacterium]